jgi:DNA-binding MarR family transcriptional regulator
MSRQANPPDDPLALAEALWPTLLHLRRHIRQVAMGHDISPLQNLLLAEIMKQPGIGVGDLARQEKVRSPTISGHIKALEAEGLVERTAPHPDDRRRVGLVVTEKGRHVVETLRRQRMDWLAARLAKLSPEARQAIRNAIAPLDELSR